MDVAFENETINDFFAKDDVPICFDQLERYLNEDEASLSLTESSNSAACTPFSQSVASTPIIPTRQQHPTHSLSASTNAVNTITSAATRHGFDNPAFMTDIKNGYQEVSPRLPDSPPDSGSEAFSPENRDISGTIPAYLPTTSAGHSIGAHRNMLGPPPVYPTGSMDIGSHHQQGILSVSSGVPQGIPMQLPPPSGMENVLRLPPYTTVTPEGVPDNFQRAPSFSTSHRHKKRKHSLTPENTVNQALLKTMGINIKQEQLDPCTNPVSAYSSQQGPTDQFDQLQTGDGMAYTNTVYQSLKWQPYQQQKWHKLYDSSYNELSLPTFRVEADKGFNFAVPDDAFVCQKKNHFQVTVHIGLTATPVYVKTDTGSTAPVQSFKLHLRGIKVEAINSNIRVEQSQADRTKKEFQPVQVDLRANEITKATVGRLHFSETTSNNMRKKGKPNPDQRYFMLVVGIHAHTDGGHFPIASHVSERIIVRASNPGQFESEMDIMWQRGGVPDSVYHTGNVGIKTETPDEALTVHGNVRVTGHIVQPSDVRAKEEFKVLDPKEQLKNIEKMKIMQYKYKQAFADYAGLPECDRGVETGVVAQELQEILPDAVYTTGDVELPTGENIDSFLVVNKDRIYMESVGAVKELCRLNNKLETRINEIEKVNRKLAKLKRLDSLKSTSSGTLSRNGSSRSQASVKSKGRKQPQTWPQGTAYLSPRAMQCTMVLLIFIMFFCVVTMAVLLVLQFQTSDVSLSSPTDSGTSVEYKDSTNGSMTTQSSMSSSPPVPPWNTSPSGCGYDSCDKYCCNVIRTTTVQPSTVQNIINPPSSAAPEGTLEQTSKNPDNGMSFPEIDDRIEEPPKDEKIERAPTDITTETFHNFTMEDDRMSQADGIDDHEVVNPSSSRKKRASGEDTPGKGGEAAQDSEPEIISIKTDVLSRKGTTVNITVAECKQPCGGESKRNFTYEIPVSVYNKEDYGRLIVETVKETKSILCKRSPSLNSLCSVNVTVDEDKHLDDVAQGPTHEWEIPIKRYVNNTYIIRFMENTVSNVQCKPEASLSMFKEYTFIFYRNIAECTG